MDHQPVALDPEHTALLVLDVQPAVLASLGQTHGLLDRIARAISVVRSRGGRVGYVRVGFDEADVEAIPPHSRMSRMAAMARDRLHKDAPATAVHDHVAPAPGDLTVRKTRVGAFAGTDLDDQLHGHDITTLLLAGVSTGGVVLSTVRDAHDRDYRVYVLADATADPREHVHDFLTAHVFPAQADVIEVAQLDGLLAPGAGAAAGQA